MYVSPSSHEHHKAKVFCVLNTLLVLLLHQPTPFIVSLDKSWGYYAFVIMQPQPQPQRFLVCTLHPEFSSNHFQIQVICFVYQGLEASGFWELCYSRDPLSRGLLSRGFV